MSFSGGPITRICHTWYMTDSLSKPASPAATATARRSRAIVGGPPGQVKSGTCSPSRIRPTLVPAWSHQLVHEPGQLREVAALDHRHDLPEVRGDGVTGVP